MEKKSILADKSYLFAIRIAKLSQYLQERKEFTISQQVLKSGTAIRALINEAEFAQSHADYINKFSISLKEANETVYWLSLLRDANYIGAKLANSLIADCKELIAMLVATVKTLKSKNEKE
jgi:four helix bundle protein